MYVSGRMPRSKSKAKESSADQSQAAQMRDPVVLGSKRPQVWLPYALVATMLACAQIVDNAAS